MQYKFPLNILTLDQWFIQRYRPTNSTLHVFNTKITTGISNNNLKHSTTTATN